MKIIDRVDREFAVKAKTEQVVLEVIRVAGIDEVAGVDKVTRIDDRFDQVDGIAGVADRVDIHKVIDLS